MKYLIINLIALAAHAQEYTPDFSNRWFYCESKEGYMLTYGDADRMSGLSERGVYDYEFVANLREIMMQDRCKSLEDYLKPKDK